MLRQNLVRSGTQGMRESPLAGAGASAFLAVVAACAAPARVATVLIPPGPPAPVLDIVPSPGGAATAKSAAGPIEWETSEPLARERARRVGLPLLVWVRADWDAAGLEMERTTWLDPKVREAARPYVALRLDVSAAEGDAQRYAERYDVQRLPTILLFDARGQRVGALGGYQDAARVAEALRRAAED
jgi:thiol:disulfide interchange protein